MKIRVWYDVPRILDIEIPDEEYFKLEEDAECNQDYLQKEIYKKEGIDIPKEYDFLDEVCINKIVSINGKKSKQLYEDWYH